MQTARDSFDEGCDNFPCLETLRRELIACSDENFEQSATVFFDTLNAQLGYLTFDAAVRLFFMNEGELIRKIIYQTTSGPKQWMIGVLASLIIDISNYYSSAEQAYFETHLVNRKYDNGQPLIATIANSANSKEIPFNDFMTLVTALGNMHQDCIDKERLVGQLSPILFDTAEGAGGLSLFGLMLSKTYTRANIDHCILFITAIMTSKNFEIIAGELTQPTASTLQPFHLRIAHSASPEGINHYTKELEKTIENARTQTALFNLISITDRHGNTFCDIAMERTSLRKGYLLSLSKSYHGTTHYPNALRQFLRRFPSISEHVSELRVEYAHDEAMLKLCLLAEMEVPASPSILPTADTVTFTHSPSDLSRHERETVGTNQRHFFWKKRDSRPDMVPETNGEEAVVMVKSRCERLATTARNMFTAFQFWGTPIVIDRRGNARIYTSNGK